MHEFTKTFIMEFDALVHGIGLVLMHEQRPLSFESFQLKANNLIKPICEKKIGHNTCNEEMVPLPDRKTLQSKNIS